MSHKIVVKTNDCQYPVEPWEVMKAKGVSEPVIRHSAIQRLALETNIEMEDLRLIVSPAASNGMKSAFIAVGSNSEGRRAFATGEADATNIQSQTAATRYPILLAARRAIDRCVLDLLNLGDCYSELEVAQPWAPEIAPLPSASAEAKATQTCNEPSAPAPSGSLEERHNGDLPPTDKQLGYLLTLATKGNLTAEEIDHLMASLHTRSDASRAIRSLKDAA